MQLALPSRVRRTAALILVLVSSPACDNTFDPIDRTGPVLSVFGYIDASADTQWIRVNSLRRGTLTSPLEPAGISVTLENLTTGTTIALRDTVLPYVNMLGSDPVYAHNYWTTQRIEPGSTYRFRAETPDGAVAESLIRIPSDYYLEVWVLQPTSSMRSDQRLIHVRVERVKYLPFIRWFKSLDDPCYLSGRCGTVTADPQSGDSTARMVFLGSATVPQIAAWKAAQTIASGAEWPFDLDYSVWRLVPDSLATNVTGALGFLGGVLSKKIWLEDCALPYPSPPETYCKLKYDSTTATLRGRVFSTSVQDSVRMVELEPPTGEQPRTRLTKADSLGIFNIGAIRPGRHQVMIRSSACILTDTLQFAAGQQLNYFPRSCP